MGVRDLIEVMRAEALSRLKEERRRRKEKIRVRLLMLQSKGKGGGLERREKLL